MRGNAWAFAVFNYFLGWRLIVSPHFSQPVGRQ